LVSFFFFCNCERLLLILFYPNLIVSFCVLVGFVQLGFTVGSTFWGHYAALVEREAALAKAKEAMKAARRNTLRMQQKLNESALRRQLTMKRMSKKEIRSNMMPPIQERAFHRLFSLEPKINELLTNIQSCSANDDGMQELITDPRTTRILTEISITEQMLAFMVKDSVSAVNMQQTSSKNGVLPKRAAK
tara:strand:+ start:1053 stop:1622 length:570 start_codon:yes stop_codon:yes gene_type:complete